MDDRSDLERAWAAIVGVLTLGFALGAIVFPERVYDEFLWRYFWGPVAADGNGASCAVRADGEVQYLDSASACETASGIVAYPGYTTVSTVGYALVLVFLLAGVYFLLERLEIGTELSLLYAFFPWVLFGGALRTFEDVSVQFLEQTGDPVIAFPYTAAIISPFIYVTVFVLAVAALVASVWADDRDVVDDWESTLAGIGVALFLLVFGAMLYLAATTEVVTLKPSFLAVVIGGALAISAAAWVLTERYVPVVNAGTGFTGVLIVFGHTVDGIANVLSLDHADVFGLRRSYSPKHVVNRGVRTLMDGLQPQWLSDAVGTTWPFVFVKIGAALLVVWLFNDEMLEESPRYSVLLLIAVLAVGLGPGTRDVLRATFGV